MIVRGFPQTTLHPAGFELSQDAKGISGGSDSSAAPALQNGQFQPDLERLAELWPRLSELDRQALVDHAEHLVALRGGCEAVAGLDGGDASESRLPASKGPSDDGTRQT